jgi:hypothetical protein
MASGRRQISRARPAAEDKGRPWLSAPCFPPLPRLSPRRHELSAPSFSASFPRPRPPKIRDSSESFGAAALTAPSAQSGALEDLEMEPPLCQTWNIDEFRQNSASFRQDGAPPPSPRRPERRKRRTRDLLLKAREGLSSAPLAKERGLPLAGLFLKTEGLANAPSRI